MTPIYRSPDRDQAQAMQALLQNHRIEMSIIETKKSNNTSAASTVVWYELWLRNLNELARAKTIITQHEFTTYKTSMTSYRTSVIEQKKRSESSGSKSSNSIDQTFQPHSAKTGEALTVSIQEKSIPGKTLIPSPLVSAPSISNPFLARPASDALVSHKPVTPGQPREDLIPINNKRVFKRLGLLLGFSEEDIQKWNNNKLYRPWDAAELNETVKKLKQKCS